MTKNRAEPQYEPRPSAKLTVPLADAEMKIERQIQDGEQLFQKERFVHGEVLVEFNTDYRLWRDYSAELLRTLFSTEQFG